MTSSARIGDSHTTEMLDRITAWALRESSIRCLLLTGSRTLPGTVDELADIDIAIFATDAALYLRQDAWIHQLGTVWVWSAYEWAFRDIMVPTRLVIYEGGTKVDFSFWSPSSVDQLAKAKYLDSGYAILLDKDGAMQRLGKPSFGPINPPKPTALEFVHLVNEYWFEADHVAKYLKREDLWLVKFRDFESIKVYLLTMLEWYMLARHGWNYDVKWDGKAIEKWLEPEIYNRLFGTFAHFDVRDSWVAFIANNELFRDLSIHTASLLGCETPNDVAENLSTFISALLDDEQRSNSGST